MDVWADMESTTSDLLSLLEAPHFLLGTAAILLLLIYLTWELLHSMERILLWGRPGQTLCLPKLSVDRKPVFKWVNLKRRTCRQSSASGRRAWPHRRAPVRTPMTWTTTSSSTWTRSTGSSSGGTPSSSTSAASPSLPRRRVWPWCTPAWTPSCAAPTTPRSRTVRSRARGVETAQHTQGIAMLSSTEERVSQATCHHGRLRPSMLSSGWTCAICDHAVRESGRYKISAGMPRSQRPAVGASKDRATELTAANALLLEDAVVASLETHVLGKRVQHHLGLPLTLLKSLRSFMLPSPELTLQRSRREFSVLTRPQALSFVGSGTRKNLESHLGKMVHLKRWQLPQKIQEALGQMKPPFQSTEKTPPSPARKQGPGVMSQVKYAGKMQRTSATLPTREGVLDSKTTLASQVQLQSHLVKKSLEIKLQTFPTIVGHSQKLSSRSRVLHLPKLIPLGRSCPQWRNRLSLLLRGKVDIVEMNIKCKYIHFLWGLPTLYMQSLGKMAPGPLALPTAPAWAHATTEFVSVEPPFVETSVLENHVLRKRLQHQWGLPGLALRSLKQFLVPVPQSPIHGASVVRSHLEVKILTSAHPFLSTRLEMKEKLEAHMKTKIIERRWGLPKRALDSLRVFIPVAPPLSDRLKANKETFVLPQGEKGMRRKPPSRSSRTSKNLMISSAKAVQGPLAKKALEVRLGTINPIARRSQDAARRVGKMHPLPKVIPPGLRPLVPRSPELLFMGQAVLGHLQLNIIHKILMFRWKLPTTYNKSLAQVFQGAGAARVARSPSKSSESKFIAVQIPFISRKDQEVLEWHVRGKRLQHTWGLPGLVQRSLRHLLPTTLPLRPQRGKYPEVVVSLTEPAFLDNSTRRELERNVQKRIIHQQWRLPRRVLQSLRRLQPTWNTANPPRFPFVGRRKFFSRKAGRLSLSASPITESLCTECYVKNMGAVAPKRSQRFPRLGSKNLKKIELHSTKKCLEVQLEACPVIVKHSWKLTSSVCGLTLPKLLPPGRKALQPRKCSLPLVSQEDMGRIEVAVRVCHLMSLWGVGTRYVEGLHAMIPRTSAHSLGRCRRTGLEFSEGPVPFLDGGAREALESHVRKKRLQHEWGLPVLVRSSIQAFAKGFPPAPLFLRTKTDVQTLQQDSAFLPQETRTHLEHHLQKRKLQQQWGLPLRVLKSLHMLMPEIGTRPVDRTLLLPTITFSTEFSSSLSKSCPVEGATEMVSRAPCRARQGWGTASSLTSRQPPTPGQTGSWKARRESPHRSALQTRPHPKKAAQRQRSRVFDARQDPKTPFLSSTSPGPKKDRSNVSSRSTNLPRARCSRGRISSGRALVPRSSRTVLRDRKGRSQPVERGFQRTADSSRSRAGIEQPQAPGISQKQGSRLGRDREKRKSLLHLRPHQPSARALRRPSYGDLCEACRNLKPPPLPEGSENRTSEAGSRPPDSGAFKQRHPPVPRNQGPSERKRDSQGRPGHDFQAEADDGVAERKAEQGARSFSKEPRPLSTGEASQFSTEWEQERVGDWDTDEEAGGRRDSLGKQQRGRPKAAGEMPKTETSVKAQPSLKGACPLAVKKFRASPSSEVCNEKEPGLAKIERQSVLGPVRDGRRMVGREASVVVTARVTGPEGGKSQRPKEEEHKMLHRRKEGSRKGPHPGREALPRHGRSQLSGTPRDTERLKREALKMTQEVTKGMREHGNHTQFIQELYVKEVPVKLSLLGTIVERKLYLRQGLHIWLQSQEGETESRKRAKKSAGTSQLPTPQVGRTAQAKRPEGQHCGSRGVATPRGSNRALHARLQQSQTSRNREVCREKQPDLVKIERQRVFRPGSDGQKMVGRGASVVEAARVTGPEGGKSQRAKEEEHKMLHRKKEGSRKGPHPGREALPRHGRIHWGPIDETWQDPLGTPKDTGHLKREALKVTQEVTKGIQEHGNHAPIVQERYAKEGPRKLSLLGKIVQMKRRLREGIHTWLKSQNGEKGRQKGAKKTAGTSSPRESQRRETV